MVLHAHGDCKPSLPVQRPPHVAHLSTMARRLAASPALTVGTMRLGRSERTQSLQAEESVCRAGWRVEEGWHIMRHACSERRAHCGA